MDNEKWWEEEQLHLAAENGELEKVKQLLAEGHPINAFSEGFAWTPLHHAAMREQFDVVLLLLEAGADVNAHDEAQIGNTVLREIAESCSYEMAELLIVAGADPTIPGWMQLTALDKIKERKVFAEGHKRGPEVLAEIERIQALFLNAAKKLHAESH